MIKNINKVRVVDNGHVVVKFILIYLYGIHPFIILNLDFNLMLHPIDICYEAGLIVG